MQQGDVVWYRWKSTRNEEVYVVILRLVKTDPVAIWSCKTLFGAWPGQDDRTVDLSFCLGPAEVVGHIDDITELEAS
jgi:hypothetical protein